jgi:hypothetical protein
VKGLFQVPHEPLAPLWVARLCRAKYCNCNCNCKGQGGWSKEACSSGVCYAQVCRPAVVLWLAPAALM